MTLVLGLKKRRRTHVRLMFVQFSPLLPVSPELYQLSHVFTWKQQQCFNTMINGRLCNVVWVESLCHV